MPLGSPSRALCLSGPGPCSSAQAVGTVARAIRRRRRSELVPLIGVEPAAIIASSHLQFTGGAATRSFVAFCPGQSRYCGCGRLPSYHRSAEAANTRPRLDLCLERLGQPERRMVAESPSPPNQGGLGFLRSGPSSGCRR